MLLSSATLMQDGDEEGPSSRKQQRGLFFFFLVCVCNRSRLSVPRTPTYVAHEHYLSRYVCTRRKGLRRRERTLSGHASLSPSSSSSSSSSPPVDSGANGAMMPPREEGERGSFLPPFLAYWFLSLFSSLALSFWWDGMVVAASVGDVGSLFLRFLHHQDQFFAYTLQRSH